MRISTFTGAAATALAILAVGAVAAQADPGTVTGPRGLSLTVDDTTPAPGQTITFDFSYTIDSSEAGGLSASFTMNVESGRSSSLSLVSCGGQLSGCTYNPSGIPTFVANVPAGAGGDVVAGSATFTVSPGATNGATLQLLARHITSTRFGPAVTTADESLGLTVTAPVEADLGVSLSATAVPLSSQVSYDAAVTNDGPGAASSATITTQLAAQATGISSSSCTYAASTDRVTCPIGALANGATTHATFTASFGLLSLGPLNASATRTASSPTDPNATNDSDAANCTAVTALIITC